MAETVQTPEITRGNRKQRTGEVISNKMAKTIVVRVERRFPHPRFKKIVTGYKKLYAHDDIPGTRATRGLQDTVVGRSRYKTTSVTCYSSSDSFITHRDSVPPH